MKRGLENTVQFVKNNALDAIIAGSIWTIPLKNLGENGYKALAMGDIPKDLIITVNFLTILYFKEKLYDKIGRDHFVNKALISKLQNITANFYPLFKAFMAGIAMTNVANAVNNSIKPENELYNYSYQAFGLYFVLFFSINEGIFESSVVLNNILNSLNKDGLLDRKSENILDKYIPEISYGALKFHYFIEALYSTLIPFVNEQKIPKVIAMLNIFNKALYNSISIISAVAFSSWTKYFFDLANDNLDLNIKNEHIAKAGLFANMVIFSYYFIKMQKTELVQCTKYIKDNFEKKGDKLVSKKGSLRLTPVFRWLASTTTNAFNILNSTFQNIDSALHQFLFDEENVKTSKIKM